MNAMEYNRELLASKFVRLTYKTMPYRLFIPENYNEQESYPLVLFLHGGGERGTDNERHILINDGALVWTTSENQKKNPAFVLAPQSRDEADGGFGLTRDPEKPTEIKLRRAFEMSYDLKMAHEILMNVVEEYNIDNNRLYVTGLSQGGFGTYNLNMAYPDLFAAMVPIAGGGDPEKAELLVDKPLWNFHAEDDGIIPVSYSRNIINSIREAGGNPIYTEYSADKGYNHGSWVPAYNNPELIDWVFQQVKGKKS